MESSAPSAFAALALALACACGEDDPADWPAGRPRIDDLQFVRQAPQNPRALEFSLEFFDSDGDTGRGKLHLFLDGEATAERLLSELFAASRPAVPLDADTGRINVTIELEGTVTAGQRVELGFILEDGSQRRSNEPHIVLEALPE